VISLHPTKASRASLANTKTRFLLLLLKLVGGSGKAKNERQALKGG